MLLVIAFTWLSQKPSNDVIYYPNRILKGLDTWEGGRRPGSPFAWIGEAFSSTEDDIIDMAGVDTAVYLVFLSTVLGILFLSGIVLLPILLPVSATDSGIETSSDNHDNGNLTQIDNLSMGNISENSQRLWAFVLGTYWVSFVSFYMLWKAYKHCSDLRATAQMAPGLKPEQYAVLVRDIPSPPPGQSRKDQVDSYFRMLHPETFFRSMVITNNKQAIKTWEELEGYKKKLERAELVFSESKSETRSEGTRPTSRIGFLGLIGPKVDTIEYCNDKITELTQVLEAEQKIIIREKQQASALVFFDTKPAAASASQTLHAQMVDTWTVMQAPEPRDLLWPNSTMKFYERQTRQYAVYAIVFLAIVFYMIPITFISAFTTLTNLKALLPFLDAIVDKPAIKTVLEAYLPQMALILFLALLPTFLMHLSKAEGLASESHVLRAASGKYFYFIVFNIFLGVTLSGTLIDSLKTIEKRPDRIVNILGHSLPRNATFFLTYVALKFFVGNGLELSRLVPLIIYHLKRKYLCKTETELKEAWAPGDLSLATRVPNDMLIVTIVLCYSVIAPLIIPFGVAYFGVGWLVLRHQALKVYVPSFESNGRMWPHMHSRIVAALILHQITMLGFFGVKKFYYTPVVAPLPILSIVFAYVTKKRFYLGFRSTPLEVASRSGEECIPNMEAVFSAYVPQCLMSSDKYDGGDHFEDARSHVSRV
ncbi:CSC1-like protein erd4 [Asimina triloba]